MTVVFVSGSLPYPATAGNLIRTLNLMIRLAQRHRIILICHKNPVGAEAAEAEAVAYLKSRGIETILVNHVVPVKSGATFYARLAANLFSPLPYSIASHVGDAMRQAVETLASRERVDVWQAEGLPFFESLRSLKRARTLIMAHNVESLIWQRYFETETQPAKHLHIGHQSSLGNGFVGRDPRKLAKRWYIGHQWRKFERYEGQAFRAASRVVTVSDEDAELARSRFGVKQVDVVDNGIDRHFFEDQCADRDPNRILFLGSLEWRPNFDAVTVLLDRVFPEVKAAYPAAKLWIVGRNPPDSLIRRSAETIDVELHANVSDVRPYLSQSAVMAVPLRIGGGSRLKILESLASGLPVVSTKVGAEGLRLTSGVDLEIVDDESAMAQALVATLRNPGRALLMAEHGRRQVLERYDWDALSVKLEECWERCLNG